MAAAPGDSPTPCAAASEAVVSEAAVKSAASEARKGCFRMGDPSKHYRPPGGTPRVFHLTGTRGASRRVPRELLEALLGPRRRVHLDGEERLLARGSPRVAHARRDV